MARLPSALVAFLFGSALAIACNDDDDGGDDHGTTDHGTADHGSGDTGTNHCAELGSVCHEPGEMMGGMAMTCHDVGHDGDLAACDAIYEECIALCTGATSSGSGGADSSGGGSGSGTG